MKFIIPFLLLGLSACNDPNPAVAQPATDNPAFQVERLFTNDGCTVYRFSDRGYYYYYADCGGTFNTEPSGKTTRPNEIPTVRPKR